ncbi:bacteriocin [Jiangella aurantiaca]|uniref:Type 1 encapsulin shell protein n=1 Tax=Jiangella aurantiaca TaxID=2530373 RepID=A0A4R5A9N3_9ACTN|nr:family 1 encapsulin nanocompartment shell protein [Jiangella aurantiaca]TDD68963.1 bacteriocin [Jiangella aurantiaca]
MNNLHRELAPISAAAWADIEAEARRTFVQYVAARRVVDVIGPGDDVLQGVGTGHLRTLDGPGDGVLARSREVRPVVELRVPFNVDRQAVDDVERGAKDADWQPVKDAAKKIAYAEDRAIVAGFAAAGIEGIVAGTTNAPITLPGDVRELPDVAAQALTTLRLAGVGGPYSLLLSAELYTAVEETTDHGYPIREHVARVLHDGEIVFAPAIDGGLLLSARGGDYELHLAQDLSIGYLSHDADTIELYFEEAFTFLVQTGESGVALGA